MDKIIVKDMQFYGYHGVFKEEKKLGQRFNVDMEVFLPLQEAGEKDDLTKTVNYAAIYKLCKKIVEGQPYDLVEAVAETIAKETLHSFEIIQEVMVRVIKPDPPIPGHYQHVAVEIRRSR